MKILLCIARLYPVLGQANAKHAIEFVSGAQATTCKQYNLLKDKEDIKEGNRNMMIASEYLECSLPSSLKLVKNPKNIMSFIGKNLRIRDIPTSLGASVDDTTVIFDKLKFDGKNAFILNDKYYYINLILKGKISVHSYLFWVVDEVLEGTYRVYYPFIVKIEGKTVIAKPYYNSGF